MARVALDKTAVQRRNGYLKVTSGRKLYIYERGTTTPVSLYDAQSGGSAVAQPLESDTEGRYPDVWVEAGSYDLYSPSDALNPTQQWEAIHGLDQADVADRTAAETISGAWTFSKFPEVHVAGDRTAAGKITLPTLAADDEAFVQATLASRGRMFHLTTAARASGSIQDIFGIGVDYGGRGILINVKSLDGTSVGKGQTIDVLDSVVNGAVGLEVIQRSVATGAFALLVDQKSTIANAVQMQNSVAGHAPILNMVGVDSTTGKRIMQWQTAIGGVYTTRGYITAHDGAMNFEVPTYFRGTGWFNASDTLNGFKTAAIFIPGAVDAAGAVVKMMAGQTASPFQVADSSSTLLAHINTAGAFLGPRGAFNTGFSSNIAQLTAIGDGTASRITALFAVGTSSPSDILQLTSNDRATIYTRVNKDGYLMTRKAAAPADGDLANNELAFWVDTNGDLKIKSKTSTGTVKTATVVTA